MERVPFAIIGCGGMGGRHLLGLKELADAGSSNLELVAVCDLRRDNADHLAQQAAHLLGSRPEVYQDLATMHAEVGELQFVDITAEATAHHPLAVAAFELGLHVLCEKPMGLTARACNRILEAQRQSGRLLSVAENYRRDPMGRLTRALLDAGAVGEPRLFLDVSAGSGNTIVITPWRHLKGRGGMLLDGGAHNADLMLYYLGDVSEVYARTALWETTRHKPPARARVASFYDRWQTEMPDSIEATAEDTLSAVVSFQSGAFGNWTQSYAAHGRSFGHKVIYGSQGSLVPGGTRNGVSPVLARAGADDASGTALLESAPDYHLDEVTARLFGGDRLTSYELPFPAADRKLLALELHEMGTCVLSGSTPEVDGLVGRRAVALCYATFESGVLGRPVTLDDVEAEAAGSYEAEINAAQDI